MLVRGFIGNYYPWIVLAQDLQWIHSDLLKQTVRRITNHEIGF